MVVAKINSWLVSGCHLCQMVELLFWLKDGDAPKIKERKSQ
jgi:hypothetical protein